MRTILFFIPAELFDLPMFGIGLVLAAWIVFGVGLLIWLVSKQGWSADTLSYLPFLAIVALVLIFVLPNMVESVTNSSGVVTPLGIPVRGFGVMLMLGTVAGVGLAAYRAQQMGIDPEAIYTLAFWMFLFGIAGARLFYILQYRDQFEAGNFRQFLFSLVNVTKGGLVVYGSVLAGLPAGIFYLRSRNLPILALADIIAPSMVVGLALGRMGCFLNGCCYGGYCENPNLAFRFPADSPPHERHLSLGFKSGLLLTADKSKSSEDAAPLRVQFVEPHSPAAQSGLKVGDLLTEVVLNGRQVKTLAEAQASLNEGFPNYELTTLEKTYQWTAAVPSRSAPIHATQLYAALDGGLLALFLWLVYPFRTKDGQIFALLITLHPISRFLLEMVRSDEGGQFGTQFTISQWISLGFLVAAGLMWAYLFVQPPHRALPNSPTS